MLSSGTSLKLEAEINLKKEKQTNKISPQTIQWTHYQTDSLWHKYWLLRRKAFLLLRVYEWTVHTFRSLRNYCQTNTDHHKDWFWTSVSEQRSPSVPLSFTARQNTDHHKDLLVLNVSEWIAFSVMSLRIYCLTKRRSSQRLIGFERQWVNCTHRHVP